MTLLSDGFSGWNFKLLTFLDKISAEPRKESSDKGKDGCMLQKKEVIEETI